MPDGVHLLASTALFRGFSEQELEPLASRLQPRSFPRGSYIFREGDPGHTFYVIADGQVKIAHLGRQGEEIVFALLTTGDTFGELALFDEASTRTADAQATEPTDCLALNREPFMTFAETHPPLMRHLTRVLSVYLRRADEALAEAAFMDITGRVAKKLLDLSPYLPGHGGTGRHTPGRAGRTAARTRSPDRRPRDSADPGGHDRREPREREPGRFPVRRARRHRPGGRNDHHPPGG